MTEVTTINLFYPLLFITIGLFIIVGGVVIIKCKDSTLFNNIFNKHSDEHIDTTDKMCNMHDKVVTLAWDSTKEQELHRIECLIKEISFKVDALTERVIYLEKHKD